MWVKSSGSTLGSAWHQRGGMILICFRLCVRTDLSSELIAAVDTFELPHAFVATQVDAQLLPRWWRIWEQTSKITSAVSFSFFSNISYLLQNQLLTFEGFAADVTAVGAALFVLAGLVPEESAFLREALLTDVAAEGTLACVSPVVFIQTGWRWNTEINTNHNICS